MIKLILSLLLVLPAAMALSEPVSGTYSASVIEPALLESLKTKGTTSILIDFKGGNSAALNSLENKQFSSREERLKAVNQALEENAANSQKNVQAFLRSKNVEFTSLWINNSISVKSANLELVQELAKFEEVGSIKEDRVVAHITSN